MEAKTNVCRGVPRKQRPLGTKSLASTLNMMSSQQVNKQTKNQFNDNATNGRKKFGTSSKIINELRRAVRTTTVWQHNTPSDLVKLFEYDILRKYLPVRGNRVIRFSYTNLDVLSLLRTFSISCKVSNHGKKLYQSPIFSKPELCCVAEQDLGYQGEYPYYTQSNTFTSALTKYHEIKSEFERLQHYNIDADFHYAIADTFMCCMNELLEIVRSKSVYDLSTKLFEHFSNIKFKRLDPYGIYMFLLHLKIRGVADVEWFRNLSTWRNGWNVYTPEEKQSILDIFLLGVNDKRFNAIQQLTIAEQEWKFSILSHEAKLIRYASKIGRRVFNPQYIYYTTFYNAIFEQMSPVERYRSSMHMTMAPLQGAPTMFSVTKPISDAVSASIDESLPKVQETLKQTVQDMLSSPEIKDSLKDLITGSMEPTIKEFEKSTEKVSTNVLTNLKSTMQPMIDQTFSLFSSINGLVDFFKSILKQALDAFPSELFGRKLGINITPDSLLSLLKYYIVYVNVESKPLKIALIYLMLKELDLIQYIVTYGGLLYNFAFNHSSSSEVPLDGTEIEGEPTSSTSWLTNLAEMIFNNKNEISLCAIFTSLFVIIFKHTMAMRGAGTMRFNEYSTITGVVTGICKNLHWIGNGMLGIDRVYKYFIIISKSLTKYIREHLYGITDSTMTNEMAVARWLVQLKFFSTDTGRNSIRVSDKILERAERIMAEGLAFISSASKDPSFISRDSLMNIHRAWNDVKVLANYTYRIRSTSNFKPAMFHVQFVGEPGIGKSTLTESFINGLSRKIYRPDKKISHWTYNPNVDHFDGYNAQTYMIIDDLFRYNEPKHLSLVIGLITNTPVPLPMAHLEDKGVHLDSDILISSTNVPYPIGKDIFCMEAVHRRRHILCEVTMDSRVKKNGKFCKEMFDQYYPGKNSYDFPHLKFSLMKPVVTPGEDPYQQTDSTQEEWKYKLIKKLQKANDALKFEPDFYFGPDSRPLEGMTVPCTGWGFNTFVENVAVAYKSLRSGEQMLSAKEKYEHVMECFAELDNIFVQSDDIAEGVAASTTFKLIADKFLDASLQYGMDDPLGKKIYNAHQTEVAPDMADLDINAIVDEFLSEEEGKPTSDTSSYSDSFEEQDDLNEFWDDHNCTALTSEQNKMEEISNYFRTNDIKDPARSMLLQMMHKLAMKQYFTPVEDRLYNYVIGKAQNPFPETSYQDVIPGPSGHETSRRIRIMQKLQKQVVDPLLDNQMKVRLVKNNEGAFYPAIPIWSFYTDWECSESRAFPGENFENYLLSDQIMESSYRDFHTLNMHSKPKFLSFFKELNSSHKFYYPCREPYTLDQRKQGDSRISLEFLRRLDYVEGEWHMDVSDLDYPITNSITVKKNLNNVQKIYSIPIDVAFFCSINPSFTYTANTFSLLTSVQQTDMVKTAKWIHQHMYSLNKQSLRERIYTIAKTIKRKTMAHVFQTVSWVWDKLKAMTSTFVKIAAFAGTIYILKQIGSLFSGTSEPTSKFLHRAQIKTGMRYRGVPQHGFLDKAKTQECLAQQYLDKNIKFFKIINEDGRESIAHGIHTKQFLIINAHTATLIENSTVLSYRPTQNSDVEWEVEINPKQVYALPGNDVAIIFSRHLPMAKDILHHFITQEDFESVENVGELWSLTNFDHQQTIEIRDRCIPHKKVSMVTPDGVRGEMSCAMMVDGATVGGKSGSMLISPSKRPGHRSIIGIQAWKVADYYKQTVVYQVVTQEMLDVMIKQIQKQVGLPIITQEGPLVCEPTSAKAEGIVTSHINIEGSVPKEQVVGMIGRTQFRKTQIAPFMYMDECTPDRVPAALNPWDHRLLTKHHPMQHSVNKHGTGKVGSFDLQILDRASQDMAYWLRERLDKQTFNTDLSFEECITGIREPGSNPVDCRKSAGLPYILDKYPGKPKGKKAYVDIDEEGQCVINSPEFVIQFAKTFAKLQQGIIPKHTSYDFPKDELRPFYKALGDPLLGTPPKTRSVTCMNMEMIFSWRKVMLDLMSSFHRASRGDFPFGPGINPEGPDWTRLFHYLNKHPHCLDFDVSNWDGHLPPELMYAVADMLIIILRVGNNSPTAKVIYSLLTEVLFGHIQFEDLVYQKCRGLISGFPGTAEVNTLVHLLLMYYFYLYICQLTDNIQYATIHDFFYFSSPMFYGDDVIISISSEILGFFNGQTIAEMYKQHGYPVTSASKSKEIPKRKDLMECTFLKSGFNFISPARVDRVMDISVCYDLMYWVRAKEHPYDQFRSNLFDSFRLIHGHGVSRYNEIKDQVNQWLRKARLEPFDYRWEDFENDKIQKYYSD
nr:MAG: RNA-dependent RNA polymerase [Polycipiviridae sp.]